MFYIFFFGGNIMDDEGVWLFYGEDELNIFFSDRLGVVVKIIEGDEEGV